MLDISPLSILGKRQVNWMPPHFHVYSLEDVFFWDDPICDWIENKLKGRYSLVKGTNSKGSSVQVGFEDEKELTFFMLACPYIRS